MASTMAEMVAAVKRHAREHYNEGGWDSIVECYDDDDIARDIGDATTVESAIHNVGVLCGMWDDKRQDALAEVF